MNIQGSQGRKTEKLRSQDLPKGNHDHQMGIGFLEKFLSGLIVAQEFKDLLQ